MSLAKVPLNRVWWFFVFLTDDDRVDWGVVIRRRLPWLRRCRRTCRPRCVVVVVVVDVVEKLRGVTTMRHFIVVAGRQPRPTIMVGITLVAPVQSSMITTQSIPYHLCSGYV